MSLLHKVLGQAKSRGGRGGGRPHGRHAGPKPGPRPGGGGIASVARGLLRRR